MDRMAAEAPSWVVDRTAAEAAMDGHLAAAATRWDPVPTRSTVAGSSIAMTIVVRIAMTIVARIGTAITGPTLRTVAPAGLAYGHLTGGAASGCAATSARTTDTGTITIVHTADIGTAGTAAIMAGPMAVARPLLRRTTNADRGSPARVPGSLRLYDE